MSFNEAELMNKCQRALEDGTYKDPLDKLRLQCLANGVSGIVGLGRAFRRIDHDGKRSLTLNEFIKGLHASQMYCSDEEDAKIFDMFDTDGSGTINMDEFLIALRPAMSQSRIKSIEDCFRKLDKTSDGAITLDDLKHVYSVQHHPLYVSGEQTEAQILKKFLATFEEGALVDAHVTKEEFFNYYAGVSASVDNDCYFDLLLRQTYKL